MTLCSQCVCQNECLNVRFHCFHWSQDIISSPPSAAYMRQWTRSELVQVMACRLFGAKPLPEPMLAFCQLDSWEHISVKFEWEFYNFLSKHAFGIVVCQTGGNFVQGEISYFIWPTRSRDILRRENTLPIGTSAIMKLMPTIKTWFAVGVPQINTLCILGFGSPFIYNINGQKHIHTELWNVMTAPTATPVWLEAIRYCDWNWIVMKRF